MLALIDCDSIVYACGFSVEHKLYHVFIKGNEEEGAVFSFQYKKELNKFLEVSDSDLYVVEETVEVEPLENCLSSIKLSIQGIIEAVGADEYKVFLTGDDWYRYRIATIKPYKGNRDALHKPVYYKEAREYLINTWNAEVSEEIEADDAVAILQTEMLNALEPSCVCSIDKDLDQIPGLHYNWKRDELYTVENEEGLLSFYSQMLTGDTSDNIPGIPKIGPVTALNLLQGKSVNEMKCEVGMQYALHYEDPEAAMLEVGRLLWMRRHKDDIWEI
jgi:hypothetical protein